MPRELFDGLGQHRFNEETCFLCGASLTASTRSDEHVFPKWLQHQFGLWDQRITLLNGTTLPYRQLKIPCCVTCNNEHLSGLETRVQAIFSAAGTALSSEEERDLYLWSGKLMFGILYRELLLPLERKDPALGPILEPAVMQQFRMLHFFLQSIRLPMRFLNGLVASERIPASVYYFDVQCPTMKAAQFDFKDNPATQCVFVRVGAKGLVGTFDGGAQDMSVGHLLRKYAVHTLHPLQFDEIGAKVFYKASTLNRIPYYMIAEAEGGRLDVIMMAMDDARRSAHVERADIGAEGVLFRCAVPRTWRASRSSTTGAKRCTRSSCQCSPASQRPN
jgi:hypothetical protein